VIDRRIGPMMKVRGNEDLRVADCEFVVHGEVPGEIVAEVVEHLREAHDIEMPDAEAILEGKVDEAMDLDEETRKIVQRLREALELSDVGVRDETTVGEERPSLAAKK
jgi:predicted small metal-binding protein